jgi:hypothetical protein
MLAVDGKYKGYRLRVTGHSLGAGCAVLLTLLLRSKFKNARCLAFSPPGCTVSKNLAEEASAFTTSFILDSDVIPRFTREALDIFRDEVFEMIARIKIPKHQVGFNRNTDQQGRDALGEFLEQALHDRENIPRSTFYKQLEEFREYQTSKSQAARQNVVPLFPPGKIIQLLRTHGLEASSGGGCLACFFNSSTEAIGLKAEDKKEMFSYTARWAEREDLGRIALSDHFLSDHKTMNIRSQLRELAEIYKLKEPYSSVLYEPIDC